MNTPQVPLSKMLSTLNWILILASIVWTALCLGSLSHHTSDVDKYIEQIAQHEVEEAINRDMLYRLWASEHGGVYVPVTEKTSPNPYLAHIKERDIITPSGRRLTLMNPAYMARQVYEFGMKRGSETIGHGASTRPLLPENKPDAWEQKAFAAIGQDKKDFGELVMMNGQPGYRLLKPLYVEQPCLECHAAHGDRLGDLRGGISAAIPLSVHLDIRKEHLWDETKHSGLVWIVGLLGMMIAAPFIRRRIVERELAVSRVEESERRMRAVVDNAPFGAHMYRLEQDGRMVFIGANEPADRILGVTSGRFVGMTIDAVFPALAGTDREDAFRKVAATGEAFGLDCVEYGKMGIRGECELHAFQTAPGQMAVFFRDITERKKAERDLSASREQYRALAESVNAIAWEYDIASDRWIYVAPQSERILGYAPGEWKDLAWWENHLHPDDRKWAPTFCAHAAARGEDNSLEYRFLTQDGRIVWLYDIVQVELMDGKPVKLRGVMIDITTRKQAEEALRRSEEFTRSIIESEPECVKLLGPGGILRFINPAGLAMMEADTLDAVIGKPVHPIVVPEYRDAFVDLTEQVFQGKSGLLEFEIVGLHGTRRWLETHAVPLRDSEGNVDSVLGITRDVTPRKRAEDAYRESQERLGLALESARMGVFEWDLATDRWRWDDAVRRSPGEHKEIFTGTSEEFFRIIHSDDRDAVRSSLAYALIQGANFETEYRSVRPDRSIRTIAARGRVYKDKTSRPQRITGVLWDISERKASEELVQREAARTKVLLNLHSAAAELGKEKEKELFAFVLDQAVMLTDSRIGFIHRISDDQAHIIFTAWSRETLDSCAAACAGHFPIDKAGKWADSIRFKRPVVYNDFTTARDQQGLPSGHAPVLRFMSVPIIVDDKVALLFGVGNKTDDYTERDVAHLQLVSRELNKIMERHRVDLELRQSEERFRTLFESAPDAILLADPETGVIYDANKAAEKLMLRPRGELIGVHQSELHASGNNGEEPAIFRKHASPEVSAPTEHVVLRKDGKRIPVQIGARTMVLGGKQYVMGVFRDISEQRKAEAHRRKLEDQLMQSQKIESVGRLAGGVAHDINNMLTPIFGYIDLTEMRLPPSDPIREDLMEIANAAERIRDMTGQLLAFARKQTLKMARLDLNAVITGFSRILKRTLREDIEIRMQLAPSAGHVQGDARQLEQVLLNLAVNAQDAMPSGGIFTLATRSIAVDAAYTASRPGMTPGSYTQLTASDTGCGMDDATRARIFEPFFTTKESGRGTGLGLATVYGIVKQHGGYIEVVSTSGEGAEFHVYLPVDEQPDSPAADATLMLRTAQGSETILVVEDQEQVLRIVASLLIEQGYHVLTASRCQEALDIVETYSGEIHLIVSDVIMPQMNGKELFERISAKRREIRILYMSGYPGEVLNSQGVMDNAVNFIRKPFHVQELSSRVRQVLAACPVDMPALQ